MRKTWAWILLLSLTKHCGLGMPWNPSKSVLSSEKAMIPCLQGDCELWGNIWKGTNMAVNKLSLAFCPSYQVYAGYHHTMTLVLKSRHSLSNPFRLSKLLSKLVGNPSSFFQDAPIWSTCPTDSIPVQTLALYSLTSTLLPNLRHTGKKIGGLSIPKVFLWLI